MPTATPLPDREKTPRRRSKRSTLGRATEVWWVQLLLRSVHRRRRGESARSDAGEVGLSRPSGQT